MARAIDWPSEVLPTPGGPTKQRIGALPFGASFRTARYSTIRRLIFSRSKWSSSRMRRAAAMSIGFSSGKRPGQFDQPIEIGPDHPVFAGGLRHALQAAKLLAGLVLDLLGHLGAGDRLVEFGDLGGLAFVGFAELALDRGHLLAQQDLAVARVERSFGVAADLLRQSQNLDAMGEKPRDPREPGADVDRLQNLLFLVGRRVHEGRDQVGELRRGCSRSGWWRRVPVGACGRSRTASIACCLEMDEAGLDLVSRRRRLRDPDRLRDEERPAGQIVGRSGSAARPGRRCDACRLAR